MFLRHRFKQFDNAYIRPCLIRDLKGSEPKILETYSKLAMRDAMDMMNRNPGAQQNGLHMNKLNAESMAALIRANYSNGNLPGASGDAPFEESNWNLDLQELEYSMSRKDMNDAKIHHLLAEELYKPSRRQRRLSYSRHAVDDKDLGTEPQPQVNYRTQMNFRKMVSHGAMKASKTRRTGNVKDGPYMNGRISYGEGGEEYDNPVFTMSDETLQRSGVDGERDGDVGIYFIAGGGQRVSPARRMTLKDEDGNTSPTAMEQVLPWHRGDDDSDAGIFAVRQNEFPAWASNKEYLAYNSPTNTFLGGIGGQPKIPSVIGLFKRDSIGSASGSRRGSLQSIHQARMDSPRHSIGSDGSMASAGFDMSGMGPLDSSGPLGVPRRGSTFLATPILEVAEETDNYEGSRSSSSQSTQHPVSKTGAAGEGSSSGHADSESAPGGSTSSPAHAKPTSPSHVSSKVPQLEKIGEEDQDAPSSSEPDPQTKL
ncbi:Sodium/hydrogen exchanger 5 [Orchesella cincta]|uniref:Sodium/hydrogen exchanger 5 n=1 Tax=Orchesella cincta TaxID=48709 RepID=A0A1D2N0S3_ORCCI|nr:Sodium/hydrogen exchanger 5 [Orchesella cincta]